MFNYFDMVCTFIGIVTKFDLGLKRYNFAVVNSSSSYIALRLKRVDVERND